MKLIYAMLILAVSLFTLNTNITYAEDFVSKDLTFNNGETILAATLTIPDTLKAYPTVVMATGSGQQNRDEEIYGFKIFKIIAEHLTKNGFAVLRIDDRGAGKSKGDLKNATTHDFAMDVLAGIKEISKYNYIDTKNLGVFGHSEGGAIATIIANENPEMLKFIVLMAGPVINCGDIIISQIRIINKSAGKTDKEIEESIASQKTIYKMLQENKSNDEIKEFLILMNLKAVDQMSEEQRKTITDKNTFAKGQAEMIFKQISSPWFKYFIQYTAADYLPNLKCRVIGIFGEKDTQVPADVNTQELEKVMKLKNNSNYTIKIFPEANHLFQKAVSGLGSEYFTLPKEFVPGFLDYIVEQVKAAVK